MQPTPAQLRAITLDAPRICVDAGAGSGKTRVLVERIVRLVEDGVPLDGIVAITFTDRAAAEMKHRLRKAFHARAGIAERDTMTLWRGHARAVETARISTIHGFCTALLKEHALRLGIDPDFAPLDEAAAHLLAAQTARETVHDLLERGHEHALRLAGAFRVGAILDIVTTLLRKDTEARRALERQPCDDAEVLARHWRTQVAAEREAHLAALRDSVELASFLGELRRFDGLCAEPPDARERIRRLQVDALRAIGEGREVQEIDVALARLGEAPRNMANKKQWPDTETTAALKALQDEVREWLAKQAGAFVVDEEAEALAAAQTVDLAAVFGAAHEAFANAKRAANRVSFDDLVVLAQQALRDNAEVRERVARGIAHLLIDEFQDTDTVQLEIATRLHEAPGGPSLFIVGDAKQSIYYFRGAEVEVFQEARAQAAESVALDTNFRATPGVLGFVNHFFAQSGALRAVEPQYAAMRAHRNPLGETCVEFMPIASSSASMESLRREEADRIAGRIRVLCADDAPPCVQDESSGILRRAALGDIAILFRSMGNVGLYEDALRRAGIPYVLGAGAGFYERQEVVDVINALRVALDPFDEPALFAFLRGPLLALSDDFIVRMTWAYGSLARAMAVYAPAPDDAEAALLDDARALLAALRARVEDTPGAMLRLLLEHTGFEAILLAQHLGAQKAGNLRKLVALADDFAQAGLRTVRPFVRYLDDVRSGAVREGEAPIAYGGGTVALMTIHKSKGLEFPIVIVPDMAAVPGGNRRESGALLHRRLGLVLAAADPLGESPKPAVAQAMKRCAEREASAESARLLYVALTRAKDRLILCGGMKDEAPEKGSWFAALDGVLNFTARKGGEPFGGGTWRATVAAAAGSTASTQSISSTESTKNDAVDKVDLVDKVDEHTLARRIAPLAPATARASISVSALLDAMAGGFDEHVPRREGEERPAPASAANAVRRGEVVHRLLQRWDFTQASPPNIAALLHEMAAPLSEHEKWRADLESLAARLQASPLAQRLRTAARVEREVPFFLPLGDCVLSGTIDAVLDDGTIVDYKTGAPGGDRRARYEWQLLLYAAAYRALRGKLPKEGLIYYIDQDQLDTVRFQDSALDDALRQAGEIAART